jgi:hypothetical protein
MTIQETLLKAALWRALTTLRYNRAANQDERDAVVLPFLDPLERELTEAGYSFENGSMVVPAVIEEPVAPKPASAVAERRTFFVPKPEQDDPVPVVPVYDEPAPTKRVFPKKTH